MGGAQAQVLSAAQISLWARIGQLHAADVEAAIRQRRLVIEGMIHAALEAMHEPLTRREIAEQRLLRRYLQTFGPAMPADFAYWVGIPLRDARAIWVREEARLASVSIEGPLAALVSEDVQHLTAARPLRPPVRLLPSFDAHLLGYRDRRHLTPPRDSRRSTARRVGWRR